jgi:rsbT co-antagonist protein RsbR
MTVHTSNNRVAAFVDQQQDAICRLWIDTVKQNSRNIVTSAEVEQELVPLFKAIMLAARAGVFSLTDPAFAEVRAMLAEYSRRRARQGVTPSDVAIVFFVLRDIVLSQIRDLGNATFADFAVFSKLIDDLGLETFEAYSQTREQIISGQAEQLLELSTPVVKLWEGVLAVPLVGTLDSVRTQVIMEALLQALVTTGSEHAIIDITGVPAVDTQVAQHLLKTVFAARLMGADCIISGIRPQIAQTIVSLGIEFGDIGTKATLADALRATLNKIGVEVRRAKRP